MRIYRVEDRKGNGPARDYRVAINSWQGNTHPNAYGDGINDGLAPLDAAQWIFGVSSKKLLWHWFQCKRLRKDLKKFKFKLVIYDVPKKHVMKGKCQVVFHKKKATKIEEFPIKYIPRMCGRKG